MTAETDIGPDTYDSRYYGMHAHLSRTANYESYGPDSTPHWSLPLARWLAVHTPGPVLDVGCAYGHLCRDLGRLGIGAAGIEWSAWATHNRVSPHVERGDGRQLRAYFGRGQFAAVVSLDYLEHHPPSLVPHCIGEMAYVLRPGGLMVHLIGIHNPGDDLGNHLSDPTHQTSEPLSWFRTHLEAAGLVVDDALTADLNEHPAWRGTDWRGRWIAVRDGRTAT